MPSAAVVICAYSDQRWDLFVDGIEAVLGQALPPERLLVVIDHNEGLLERVRQRFGDRVVAMPNAERQGLSGARNTGVAAAEEEIIAFLDDDALPEPTWLEALVAAYEDGRSRRRRLDPRPLGVPAPALVPARVRLGRRLHLPRHA